jgi:hypothetical protein
MDTIYFKNGEKKAHYTLEKLKIKGNLYNSDLIWYEGLSDWTKVSEIKELSLIALNTPPLTVKEIQFKNLKKSIKPTLITYTIFFLFVGISGGLLEKYQYEIFASKIKASSDAAQREEKAFDIKNTISSTNVKQDTGGLSDTFTSTPDEFSINQWTNLGRDESSVKNADGTYYTRWSKFMAVRYFDNEQVSYNYSHKFLFRPYTAYFGHANLSTEERESSFTLLRNFSLSSFVSNLFLLPFLMILFYKKKKKTV